MSIGLDSPHKSAAQKDSSLSLWEDVAFPFSLSFSPPADRAEEESQHPAPTLQKFPVQLHEVQDEPGDRPPQRATHTSVYTEAPPRMPRTLTLIHFYTITHTHRNMCEVRSGGLSKLWLYCPHVVDGVYVTDLTVRQRDGVVRL